LEEELKIALNFNKMSITKLVPYLKWTAALSTVALESNASRALKKCNIIALST
jgi:hypothetical protein